MNNTLLLTSGGFFMILLVGSAMMMMRQSRLHERYAQRVKLAHGLVAPSTFQAKAEREAIQVAITLARAIQPIVVAAKPHAHQHVVEQLRGRQIGV